jgi:phosphatidylserine/phosphatidylglycerophosphate/cardiolipin synthase-like enzyme
VVIASPVLTVGSILGALQDLLKQGNVPVRGVYDWTQMQQALHQWGADQHASWKVDVFRGIAQQAHLAGKHSTPYSPSSVHDYMHVKMVVVDDSVFTGSYNFSHSGEENAENLLRIDSKQFADDCVAFIDRLIERYSRSSA